MASLFKDKTTCNPDIRAWNVERVIAFVSKKVKFYSSELKVVIILFQLTES